MTVASVSWCMCTPEARTSQKSLQSQTPPAERNSTSKTEKVKREICIQKTVRHGIIKVVNLLSLWDTHTAFLMTALSEKQCSCEKYPEEHQSDSVSNKHAKHTCKCADHSLRSRLCFITIREKHYSLPADLTINR